MKLVMLLQPLFICIIISIFGCTGQLSNRAIMEKGPTSAADTGTENGAALFILNLSGWTMIPQDLVVLDNGQELVSLPRNKFVRVIISAGRHEFGFPYRKKPILDLDVVKGEIYYLSVNFKPRSSWAYAIEGDPIEIKQLAKEEALSLMEKLEPLLTSAEKEVVNSPDAVKPSTVEQTAPLIKTNKPAPMSAEIEIVSTPVSEEMKSRVISVLYIFNLSDWTMLSKNQSVMNNGREIARLPRNTYTKVEIPEGMNTLGFRNREEPTLELDAVKGKTYYISFAYKTKSSWVSSTETDPIEIRQLSETEAQNLLKKISYYQ